MNFFSPHGPPRRQVAWKEKKCQEFEKNIFFLTLKCYKGLTENYSKQLT